jgi:drug/metabolite transporter (DMT)-like permease
MKEETKGYLFGILSAFFWGTHSVIVRYLTSSIDGISIAAIRLYIAIIIIFIILKVSRSKINWRIKNKKVFLTVAFFGMTLNFIVFHLGLEYTTASNAMLLENTAPIFSLLFLILFLKEKLRGFDILAVLSAFIGVAFVLVGSQGAAFFKSSGFVGDCLELAAGALWAIFLIGGSKVCAKGKYTTTRLNSLLRIFIFTAILLTPWLFFQQFSLSVKDLLLLLLLGIFPTAIAFWFWYEAAARISTMAAVLIFNLSIIFTFINASIFLGEKITVQLIIGAILILAGITLSKMKDAVYGGTRSPRL